MLQYGRLHYLHAASYCAPTDGNTTIAVLAVIRLCASSPNPCVVRPHFGWLCCVQMQNLRIVEAIKAMAAKKSCTPAQLALAWWVLLRLGAAANIIAS